MKKYILNSLAVSLVMFGLLGFVFVQSVHAQSTSGLITSTLDVGSRGDDVLKLQTLLATNSKIYPEGIISGYYGPLTAKAVTQFQLAYGLPGVGRVGPLTLAKINGMLSANIHILDISSAFISGVAAQTTANSAVVSWNTSESAKSKIYYDSIPLSQVEVTLPATEPVISGTVSSDQLFSTGHSMTLSNLTSGRMYFYVVQSSDVYGNVSVTTPLSFTTK